MKYYLRKILDEPVVTQLEAATGDKFDLIAQGMVNHSLHAKANLEFDFNAAVNQIVKKFPGRKTLYVTEIHDTLRGLGVIDYDPGDFKYIETQLKGFGILVEPDPSSQPTT